VSSFLYVSVQAGKTLLVPTPRLKNHVFSKIVPPADCGTKLLRGCAARQVSLLCFAL